MRIGKSGISLRNSDVRSILHNFLNDNTKRRTLLTDCRPGECLTTTFLKQHSRTRLGKPQRVSEARTPSTEPVTIRLVFEGLRLNFEELKPLKIFGVGRWIFNYIESHKIHFQSFSLFNCKAVIKCRAQPAIP